MKRFAMVAVLVVIGLAACKHGHSVDARWKPLGFPLDSEHATIELEDDSTPTHLIVQYEDRRASKAAFELYRDALVKAGYTADPAADAGDDIDTKLHRAGAAELSLRVHRISSATVVAISED